MVNNNNSQASKTKPKTTTAHEDVESLQITFYEIEAWIEKTAPVLGRMTKELEKASTQIEQHKKKVKKPNVDPTNIEQQLIQIQKQQLSWKRNLLDNEILTNWRLSFQPGNLLRLDTNITSVEQLIQAVQKIRLLQQPNDIPEPEQEAVEDKALEVISCSSEVPKDATSVEYWQYAMGRRPKIILENYKHCRMNLNGLTKDISPTELTYIGQVFWDCLHPKFCTDWKSFWDRKGDPNRTQTYMDSGLAMMFIHVMRHDKDVCGNAQEISGFYFDRAREEFMEFFDQEPDCSVMEALLNLAMFCIICKENSQCRMYIGLCYQMATELGIHLTKNLPTNDLVLRKKYIKILMILYYYDYRLSVYTGEPPLLKDEHLDLDFYEIITINEKLVELNKIWPVQDQVDLDNNKTIVKENYFVHTIELVRLTKQISFLIESGATVKQLLAQEVKLKAWYDRLPETLKNLDHDFEKIEKHSKERDVCTSLDANTLQISAALLLKTHYEACWIILHKAILNSIRRSATPGSSPSLFGQEKRSNTICSNSADAIIKASETITRCFGWCVCQQLIICLYHASTVYCGHALNKDNLELRNKAKLMIHRTIRVLETGAVIYEGFPSDMTRCLCEFLKKHGMHNNLECSCKCTDISTKPPSTIDLGFIEEDMNLFNNFPQDFFQP